MAGLEFIRETKDTVTQASLRDKKNRRESKMDRSKKGPPEVPHREGALGDLWGTDFEGVLGRELLFLRGPAGEWRGVGGRLVLGA